MVGIAFLRVANVRVCAGDSLAEMDDVLTYEKDLSKVSGDRSSRDLVHLQHLHSRRRRKTGEQLQC